MKNIAIIPARSGSKGLKNKNIKLLNGKPLIAYTIEAAIKSNIFDEIMVSTDSELYAEISVKYGAKVPFLRSIENSLDKSSSWDVVREVINEYEKINKKFDNFALLQPTSPLRSEKHIIDAWKLMIEKDANAIVAVCEMDHSPLWANTIDETLSIENFIDKKYVGIPRQDIPIYYRVNGAIYFVNIGYLQSMENFDLFREKVYAYKMGKKSSIDIDDEIDFIMSENILNDIV